jgi:DUF4097 and DUF4098 domain-containing protein YvlB
VDDEVLIMRSHYPFGPTGVFRSPRSRLALAPLAIACAALFPRAASAEPRHSSRSEAPCTDDNGNRNGNGNENARYGGANVDLTQPAKPNGLVDVHEFGGSVHVTGWGQSAVHVKGHFTADCHVELTPSGDHTQVHLTCSHGPATGDLEIQVPQASALEVRTMSADVSIQGVSGSIHLQTISGDIAIRGGAPSEIEARSTSGDVKIDAASSSTRAHSVSGDVEVAGVRGRATIRTISGECTLSGGDFSSVEIDSVSGAVTFRGAVTGQGPFEMQSHSGDVVLHLPRTTNVDVEMRTTSGDLVIDMGSGRKTGERELDARIGAGGAKVRLRSFSGDVEVIE